MIAVVVVGFTILIALTVKVQKACQEKAPDELRTAILAHLSEV